MDQRHKLVIFVFVQEAPLLQDEPADGTKDIIQFFFLKKNHFGASSSSLSSKDETTSRTKAEFDNFITQTPSSMHTHTTHTRAQT